MAYAAQIASVQIVCYIVAEKFYCKQVSEVSKTVEGTPIKVARIIADAMRKCLSFKAVDKYRQTYLTSIEELATLRGDKDAYERLIKKIIERLGNLTKREYFLATFPFFIKTNAHIYSIIFFTKHVKGFKLFKRTAWDIFGGKSSNQNTHGKEMQQSLFEPTLEDKQCYHVSDIADYIVEAFAGRKDVPKKEVWAFVDEHPVFPTDRYKKDITDELKRTGRCKVKQSVIDFAQR